MLRTLCTALVLFVLWLLMSGVYKPLVLGFGVASVIVSVMFVRRMDNAADAERLKVSLGVFATIKYWAWLMVEIAKANWAVTKLILSPSMPINRHMFRAPYSQKTDLGQTIFANSITLTPGTISVEVEEGEFLIHAVGYSADDLDALADMDRRVTAIERDIL